MDVSIDVSDDWHGCRQELETETVDSSAYTSALLAVTNPNIVSVPVRILTKPSAGFIQRTVLGRSDSARVESPAL
jgi:hypothetical protein